MRLRARTVLVAVAVAICGGAAAAPRGEATPRGEVIDLPDTPTQLVLDDEWAALDPTPTLDAGAPERVGPAKLVAAYRLRGTKRATLVVLRFDAPNAAMWRKRTRAAAADAIEEGVVAGCRREGAPAACADLRLGKRKELVVQGVPALEWQAKNRAGALLVRLLLFRTYTLAVAIEVPRKAGGIRQARKALQGIGMMDGWKP